MAPASGYPQIPPAHPIPVIFSTEGIPLAERAGVYADWMRSVGSFDVKGLSDEPLDAVQTGCAFGDFTLMRERCSPMTSRIDRDRRHVNLDHWVFAVQVSGQTERHGEDLSYTRTSGEMTITSLARPGSVTLRQNASDALYLIASRDAFADAAPLLERLNRRKVAGPLVEIIREHIRAVEAVATRLSADERRALSGVTAALLHACLEGTSDAVEAAGPALADARRRSVERFLRANLSDPALSPAHVARALGLSRAGLYRLFEGSGGVMHVLLEARLDGAHAALARPSDRRRIYQIAAAYGFGSAEEFSRAFRRRFGCTPKDVRAGASGSPSDVPVDDGGFGGWLRQRSPPVGRR